LFVFFGGAIFPAWREILFFFFWRQKPKKKESALSRRLFFSRPIFLRSLVSDLMAPWQALYDDIDSTNSQISA